MSREKPDESRTLKESAARVRPSLKAFGWFLRLLFLLVFRIRVIGAENFSGGPYILCINHLGWAEDVLVLLFSPFEPKIHGLGERKVLSMTKWRTAFLSWLGIFIPLDRDKPRQALAAMQDVLRRGGAIALAVEGHVGTEEGALAELERGAAYLSQNMDVPLIPIGFTGTHELWLRRTITIRVGKPIMPTEFQGSLRTRVDAMTVRLTTELRSLLPGDFENPRWKPLRHFLTYLF